MVVRSGDDARGKAGYKSIEIQASTSLRALGQLVFLLAQRRWLPGQIFTVF